MLANAQVEAQVRGWLREVVVGLNLCPFARPLLESPGLRIAVCEETANEALLRTFLQELDLLQRATEHEITTTLLVFPHTLVDFEVYLQFVEAAQALLLEAGLEGLVQLASFHPQYLFAGEPAGDASHYSNRSPYPIIHLLREDMLGRALEDFVDPQQIPARNIETLNKLGVAELQRRWRALFRA
jgi:hypothetical protein